MPYLLRDIALVRVARHKGVLVVSYLFSKRSGWRHEENCERQQDVRLLHAIVVIENRRLFCIPVFLSPDRFIPSRQAIESDCLIASLLLTRVFHDNCTIHGHATKDGSRARPSDNLVGP